MSSSISSAIANLSIASIKNSLDEVRAQVYPRNETERKVYEALSSKNWGASSTLLNEIASDSNDYEKYGIMSPIIWAGLETDGKSWKQIFKTLTLVEFLIKNGSERFIESSRDKLYKIRNLQDFNYYEGTVDKGSGVREKAKSLVELLGSNDLIRSERDKARQLRNKFVGIDSRNAGGMGGGGSYGGNYGNDSYSSNSYSGGGLDRDQVSGGRYGGDSYSSGGGGGGGGGGRYGGDNDRYNDNRGSGGRGGDSFGGNSRYGGGAYDSDKPPRFSDDAPSDSYSSNNRNSSNNDVDESPYTSSAAGKSKSAGKFKVNIKGSNAPTSPKGPLAAPAAAAPEVDLFGDSQADFMSAPAAASSGNALFDAFSAPAAAPAAAAFDPFGAAPVPPAPQAAAFDPFAAAPPAAPVAAPVAAFDPFAAAPAPVLASNNYGAPAFNNNQFGGANQFAGMTAAPMGQPTFNQGYQQQQQQPQYQQQQQQPPQQFNAMGGGIGMQQQQLQPGYKAPQQHVPQQSYSAPPSTKAAPAAADNEFGDFEGASAQPSASAKAPAANKWGDLGGLVNLSDVKKNEVHAKPNSAASTAYSQQAFAGLDGFSKTPQSMSNNANRPMGYAPAAAPQQNSMMGRPAGQPMGGAPMGGYQGGMGGGMGGYQQQQPMGGMGGMGGAPMGGGGFQQQPMGGMGGMGGAPMGGYPGNNNMMMNNGMGGQGFGMQQQQPNMMGGGFPQQQGGMRPNGGW